MALDKNTPSLSENVNQHVQPTNTIFNHFTYSMYHCIANMFHRLTSSLDTSVYKARRHIKKPRSKCGMNLVRLNSSYGKWIQVDIYICP